MKNKRGFTLIELLAVIIILGILLLIAIPGVTSYITNSRKNVYVDTAKELIKGSSNLLNSGDFDTLEEGITYYMDSRCISNESGKEAQSPFGKFNPAYVLVVNENDNYNYYFQSRDETEVGVKDITSMDSLEISKIVSGVKEEDIDTSVAVGNTTKVALIDENCNVGETRIASKRVSKDGESMITLTFDNQGGTGCDMQSQFYGEEWGKLCKPKKEGLKFVGWYTKPEKQGEKITKKSKAEKSMTVYAAWTDQYATFDTGTKVNAKMKQLSGQEFAQYSTSNTSIYHISYSENEPIDINKTSKNIVSSSSSPLPIYMWFDSSDGTMWWWSEDEEPYLNRVASFMFIYLNNVVSIEKIDEFDTSYVTDMTNLFFDCRSLVNLDVTNFDTSNVTSMGGMFGANLKLENLDLSTFDTSKVTNMGGMFRSCGKLLSLDLSSFDTSIVTNMATMFSGCSSLTELDLSNFDTSNVGSIDQMFRDCSNIEYLDLSNFDTSNITSTASLFSYCTSLLEIDFTGWNTSKVTTMAGMFNNCSKLESLDLSSFDTSKVESFYYMFSYCSNLVSVDLSSFNTNRAISFQRMFEACRSIIKIDLSNFNTSKLTDMQGMFKECRSATLINVTSFDTSKVTSFATIFYGCWEVEELKVENWNTSNVTSTHSMFFQCKKITELDLSGWNTSNVTSLTSKKTSSTSYSNLGMFEDCTSLVSLDISNFDVTKTDSLTCLFKFCSSLTSIDLSSFDTSNITQMADMFYRCSNLETIYVSDKFTMENVTLCSRMFAGCESLVGGAGTHWNSSMYGITYARVDGGESSPGLFTLKV